MAAPTRWSLRLVLLAMTTFCVVIGLWTNRALHQRSTVARIEKLGGSVEYRYVLPSQFESFCGRDFVSYVHAVHFFRVKDTDGAPSIRLVSDLNGALRELRQLPRLERVHVSSFNHGDWIARLEKQLSGVEIVVQLGGVL